MRDEFIFRKLTLFLDNDILKYAFHFESASLSVMLQSFCLLMLFHFSYFSCNSRVSVIGDMACFIHNFPKNIYFLLTAKKNR